jgi:hypothetical protein
MYRGSVLALIGIAMFVKSAVGLSIAPIHFIHPPNEGFKRAKSFCGVWGSAPA